MGSVWNGLPPWARDLHPGRGVPGREMWFLETGTLRGVSARLAASWGWRVWTAEADVPVYRKLFSDPVGPGALPANIMPFCLHGDDMLALWFQEGRDIGGHPADHDPALIWLDAHWCGPHSNTLADPQCSLRDELSELAFWFASRACVILIDDARMFTRLPLPPELDPKQWPVLAEIRGRLPHHDVTERDDVLVCLPKGGKP